jgi:protein arginine kinase activator
MVCQQCQKREANVHYTQIINGKKVEMYLCTQCAAEDGALSFNPQLSLGSLLWGFPGFGETTGFAKFEQPEVVRCSLCGMSFDDFKKSGKLGCAKCYSVFRENLAPVLRRLHGSAEHTGRTPDKAPEIKGTDLGKAGFEVRAAKESGLSKEIDRLKAELSKAIENEHYEKAAELRDRIRSLENSQNVNGGAV